MKALTTEQFIEKANKVHNNKYQYDKVEYTNAHTKVTITCPKHGDWETKPSTHLYKPYGQGGTGCPKCRIDHQKKTYTRRAPKVHSTKTFITEAKKVHGDTYDYYKAEFINAKTKVIIVCSEHGEFEQDYYSHLRGAGCKQCGIEQMKEKRKMTFNQFVKRAREVHGDRYEYDKQSFVDTTSRTKIKCPDHGWFEQLVDTHINAKCGCNQCVPRYSKSAINWLEWVSSQKGIHIQHAENGGEYVISKRKRMKADGYCKETNTVYEFHGDYFHGNPILYDQEDFNVRSKKTFGELYQKTLEREKYIKSKGYNLVTIWEHEWREQEKLLLP